MDYHFQLLKPRNTEERSLTQSFKAQYLIKLTQLLLSLSLCSFLFSPSSLLAILHYFKLYFSTFPLQLFTHAIDKNCMFLLCNGLLVFVGIARSFSSSDGGDDDRHHHHETNPRYVDYNVNDDGFKPRFGDIQAKQPLLENEGQRRSMEVDEQSRAAAEQVIDIKCSDDEKEEDIKEATVEEGKGSSQSVLEDEETIIVDAGDEEEQGTKQSEVDDFLVAENLEPEEIGEEEEEEAEEENFVLSTEELNKKFDEFIRRMREDLRIEAQQQLIMV